MLPPPGDGPAWHLLIRWPIRLQGSLLRPPQDLVSSPSAWEAVGTNACPLVLCLATQCPPLHVGWGDHPARTRGRLPSTPHHSGTPRRPPRGPSYTWASGWLLPGESPNHSAPPPCRGLHHKHFLIKRHSCLRSSSACSPQLWMSPEQSSHTGLVVNFPFGGHRPTGHPLASLARFLGCPQPPTAPPERRWLRARSSTRSPPRPARVGDG
ncbi:hypothetical protein mRhiFer1_009119 [Rhinolophus ferrumequinum]|uniref:Uncharacterized protein n=1 Tax=Rhinolophus ferrumequinum TaxID=59479 RepID=A0A7J7SJA3_RHIFE|nr:hypothetical protein mRhiFer1_009119 [Rhinolophus ferrumequinum]